MENKKYSIYRSDNQDFDEVKKEMLEENPEYAEILTENEVYNRVYEIMNDDYEIIFNDILGELNIDTDNNLIAYGDIQLWNGTVFGIKVLGENFKSVLTDVPHGDFFELYVDLEDGELKATNAHHDGTNYITFRELRKNANIDEIEELASSGKLSYNDMDKYTKKTSVKILKKLTGDTYKQNNKNQDTIAISKFSNKKKII